MNGFRIHTYTVLAHAAKTIFTATLIGTWEINAEMLTAMSLVFFTLINILAH
jgi:cbb3-type cytochrome oxidase subunit 3